MSDAHVIDVIKETLLLGHKRSRWGNLIRALLGLRGGGKIFSGGRKLKIEILHVKSLVKIIANYFEITSFT